MQNSAFSRQENVGLCRGHVVCQSERNWKMQSFTQALNTTMLRKWQPTSHCTVISPRSGGPTLSSLSPIESNPERRRKEMPRRTLEERSLPSAGCRAEEVGVGRGGIGPLQFRQRQRFPDPVDCVVDSAGIPVDLKVVRR